jgi:hypothetical protein
MMEPFGAKPRASRCTLFRVLFLAALAMLTGCGGSTPRQGGLPAQPAAAPVNSYVGGQGNSPSETLSWSVTIDRSKNVYSYSNPNAANPVPVTGSVAALTGGSLVLLGPNGYQNGLAVEIPGDAIILRPGDTTTAPVFAVQQASCFPIGGNVKFLFMFSPGLVITNQAFFGRIYASTGSDATQWQFNNQTLYQAPSGSLPSNAIFPGYPGDYPGTCTSSGGSAAVSSAPLATFGAGSQNSSTYTLPTDYVISPGGFFFENQNYVNVPQTLGWPYPAISAWGVSEPPLPLAAGALAQANYVGFLFETTGGNTTYRTRLVGFGGSPISGTIMTGGTFPNEDPTQPFTVNMSVTFGTEDPLNNGVYYLAKLTTPDDGTAFTISCLTYGVGPNEDATCTNNAVATVGYSNGRYAIILSGIDTSGNQEMLVLFQQ